MDVSDLRIFSEVARLGGMNKAAGALNTVQSNVTTRIRLLEEELGVALFRRHSRGVVLTDAGERLLPYAEKLGRLIDDARRAVAEDGRPKGVLTVGSLETTAALHLSPLLAGYAAAHPDVDMILRTGTTNELIEAVLNHDVEAAFICGPVEDPELVAETIFHEELVLLTAPSVASLDAALGANPRIVVLRAGCSYRQRLEDLLARRGVTGARQLQFGTLEAIFGCVAAGLGVTLLPRRLIGSVWQESRVAVHTLSPQEAEVETLLIRRKDAFLTSALRAFLERVRTSFPVNEAHEPADHYSAAAAAGKRDFANSQSMPRRLAT